MKPRVALISPQVIGARQVRKATPPFGIAYLAAVLEKNGYNNILLLDTVVEDYYNVTQLDSTFVKFGLSDEDVVKRLKEFKPDIIGVSILFASQTECAISMIKAIKDNFSVPLVVGGNHASHNFKLLLEENKDYIDYIILGEGDYTFLHFLERYFNGEDWRDTSGLVWYEDNILHINQRAAPIENIDELPFPAFHLYDMEKYFKIGMPHNPFTKSNRVGSIFTSRGCPFNCYYCSVPSYFGRRFRAMSSKRVIEWVHSLVERYKIKELQILDDNFTVNYNRCIEILDGIKHLGLRISFPNAIRADLPKDHNKRREMFRIMKEAGVAQVGLSAEHGDQKFLNEVLGKNLNLEEVIISCNMAHEFGILVHVNFMMGFPFETKDNRDRTIEFARRVDADSFSVSLVAPLPGTLLWDIVEKNNLFLSSFNLNRMVLAVVNIKPYDISSEDLYNLVDKLNRELNEKAMSRPGVMEKYKLFEGKTAEGDRKYHFKEVNNE
jgi:anaerobic magnesium-protoporphyrin IX monomethyl ester cyclase